MLMRLLQSLLALVGGWLVNWGKANKLAEAETKAEAKSKAMESVQPVRGLEEEMREAGKGGPPPRRPRLGQPWVNKDGNRKEWNGKEWVDAETNDADIFNDSAFNNGSD